jgi:hypothetical protein
MLQCSTLVVGCLQELNHAEVRTARQEDACAASPSLRSEKARRVCAEESLLGEVVEPRIDRQAGPSLQLAVPSAAFLFKGAWPGSHANSAHRKFRAPSQNELQVI